MRGLSGAKAGWIPFNEKIKINTVEKWDGKDKAAPTYDDDYDTVDTGSKKKDDL